MTTHDDVRALAVEYALGILDAGERATMEQHLAGCAACRAHVAEERRVLDALGRSVPQVAPPASLRDRVLAAAVTPAKGAIAAPRPVPRARPMRDWLIAASVMLMIAAGAWQILSMRERAEQARAMEETARAEQARAIEEAARAEQARAMAVVAAADLVRFDLSGAGTPAHARALWSHRHGMVFSAEGLAALPEGRTYQLWVISRGAPISAGVFGVSADGRARVVMPTPDSLTSVEAVAVTVEPAGGMPAPSTTPILAGAASTSD